MVQDRQQQRRAGERRSQGLWTPPHTALRAPSPLQNTTECSNLRGVMCRCCQVLAITRPLHEGSRNVQVDGDTLRTQPASNGPLQNEHSDCARPTQPPPSAPGIGRLSYEAILNRDYPVVVAIGFIASVLTLLGTLISDLLYMVVDPRVRL